MHLQTITYLPISSSKLPCQTLSLNGATASLARKKVPNLAAFSISP
jgi:hypothetical protein